jgi:uncharacterized protein (DUF1778 family)
MACRRADSRKPSASHRTASPRSQAHCVIHAGSGLERQLPCSRILAYLRVMLERIVAISKRRKTSTSRVSKRERIELRVTASAKQLIRRAMAVSGLTAGDLAYEGARRVLDEHGRMVLTGKDRDAFLAAIANPRRRTGSWWRRSSGIAGCSDNRAGHRSSVSRSSNWGSNTTGRNSPTAIPSSTTGSGTGPARTRNETLHGYSWRSTINAASSASTA